MSLRSGGLWGRGGGLLVAIQICLVFGRLRRLPGARDRRLSFRGTAVEGEAVCAHRMVRPPSWNSFLRSIGAMRRGVVREVLVVAYDQIYVGAMDRPQSSQGTAAGNEAVCALRTVRLMSWNSLLMSIGAMKRGVAQEVWAAAYDHFLVGIHQTCGHWEAVQAELRSQQRQFL